MLESISRWTSSVLIRSKDFLPRLHEMVWALDEPIGDPVALPDFELERPLTPFFENETPPQFLNKLMLINQRLKGVHLIQPKVERMLAAHGLLPLSPLFDKDLIRLSFAIPPKLKLSMGQEKIIMKQAFAGRLPESILHRPKSGMRVPVHYWMQKEMRRTARSVLCPKKLKSDGVFDPKRVKQLLSYQTEEGPGRYGLRLWMLMTFQIWKGQFNL